MNFSLLIEFYLLLRSNPLSRSISVYYFWGELFKLAQQYGGERSARKNGKKRRRSHSQEIGKLQTGLVKGRLFTYHGNETSIPPAEIAQNYAKSLPYRSGMPGPSLSWSVFSDNVEESIQYLKTAGVSPMLLERLDESLVVLRHYLGWSLADVVVTKPRKALSPHPGWEQWPLDAVKELNRSLQVLREYEFYSAVNAQLDVRLAELTAQGIDVSAEVAQLKALRARVTAVMLL